MKILIVSHNVLSRTTAMGKTLLSYFYRMEDVDIAQFYIHSEVPTDGTVCKDYYRFTDIDALKSHIPIKSYGKIYKQKDIHEGRFFSRTDNGVKHAIYQYGRKRTAGIYFLRNLVWETSHWNTRAFRKWIREFSPDVVFFASGDYAFMYKIAVKIAKIANCPLVCSCMDDYYINNTNSSTLFGRLEHASFMKTVKKAMKETSLLFCMCDQMREQYEEMFGVKAYTLYTPARKKREKASESEIEQKITYMGNLGLNRYKQIIDIGKALSQIENPELPHQIEVYSCEKNRKIIERLSKASGVVFHGQISSEEVECIMRSSMMVVHTEAFDEPSIKRVRYSISTKIADSLMNAACIFAYGSQDIASIEYLNKNKAAYVVTSKENLKNELTEILLDKALREKIRKNAEKLAENNHNIKNVQCQLRMWLEEVVDSFVTEKNKNVGK